MSNNIKPRDVEALFFQYRNLINRIYSQESTRFVYGMGRYKYVDKVKQDDLYSYIVTEFVKLVKEYEAHSPVDFPGYIKEKLILRTRHSYLKKLFKDWDREALGGDGFEVEQMYEKESPAEFNDKYKDSPLIDDLAKTDLEQLILTLLITKEATNNEIIKFIQDRFPDLDKNELNKSINTLKERARARAYRLNMAPKRRDKSQKELQKKLRERANNK